ncbi:hypothetical protein HUU05_14510, partial [candidate division KSB1 bacterium]|nr:hypothetical protein [candidate division KSB1 bacterium]
NGEAFLTTYWATTSDTPDHPLVGYHHDGSSVSLSVDELPTIPALVIAKCEHRGNHDLPEVCGDDCGGGGGGGSSSDNLILESIVIYNDHEPPWKGAPEIRMVFWNNPNNPTTSNYTRVEDLTNVDDENTVYNLNRAVYNWTTNGSSNGEILAEVMEDDGLPPLDGNDALAFFYVDRLFYSVEYLEPNKCRIYVRTQP